MRVQLIRRRRYASSRRLRTWSADAALLAVLAACWLLAFGDEAMAGRHAWSRSPHWMVGQPSEPLSTACRQQRFNQIKDHRYFIGYRGERGAGVTGVARKGFNLRDRAGLAEDGLTYHFADDGLSTCRVYVAGKAIAAAPPAKAQ